MLTSNIPVGSVQAEPKKSSDQSMSVNFESQYSEERDDSKSICQGTFMLVLIFLYSLVKRLLPPIVDENSNVLFFQLQNKFQLKLKEENITIFIIHRFN